MEVLLTEGAEQDLKQLDRQTARRILKKIIWFASTFGLHTQETLTGRYRGYFKLRIGDWRVIYEINRTRHALIIHVIGHRSRVYL